MEGEGSLRVVKLAVDSNVVEVTSRAVDVKFKRFNNRGCAHKVTGSRLVIDALRCVEQLNCSLVEPLAHCRGGIAI